MTSGVCTRASRAISVLFVDDDEDTLFAYRLLATEEGMNVEVAQAAQEAITLANLLLPDVIVLDVGLRGEDGLDGLEVVRRLRANACTSAIPIIIVSGYDGERDIAAVRASGCDGHLIKPCGADVLFGLVSTLAMSRRERASGNGDGEAQASTA